MKRLQLKKEVVAKLNDGQMNQVKGGMLETIDCDTRGIATSCPCLPKPVTLMTECNCNSYDIICP